MNNHYLEGEKYWELTIIWEALRVKWRRHVVVKCSCWMTCNKWIWTISTNLHEWITNYCWLIEQHKQKTGQDFRHINKMRRLKRAERIQRKKEVELIRKEIKRIEAKEEEENDKIINILTISTVIILTILVFFIRF